MQEVNNQTDLRNCFTKLLKYKEINSQFAICSDSPFNKSHTSSELDATAADNSRLFDSYQLNALKESDKSHEAGYDALMTGFVFFKSLELLKIAPKGGSEETDKAKLDFFENRLNLSSLSSSFDMRGDDNQSQDNKHVEVFYVKQLNVVEPQV